ncbi:hypothetical protein pb186bvf_020203 [Paramecium bursaria]
MDVKAKQLQQVTADLFSLVLPDCKTIVVFSCKQKKVIIEIDFEHLNVTQVHRYFISDDLSYLVLVEWKKQNYISKILNLTENTNYTIKLYQMIGIKKGVMLGIVQYHDKVTVLKQYELLNGNSSDGVYFDIIGHTYCKCFESSQLFIQTLIQRYWLFLRNNKRFQYDEIQEASAPLLNFDHNKNYYIFGQNNRTQAKFMVRLNQRMKKVRQLFFNTFDPVVQLFGQWIYVRGANLSTRQFPFYRLNVSNARIELMNTFMSKK